MTTILFDIGGTKTRVSQTRNGDIDEPVIFKTPQNPEEGISALIEAIETLRNGEEVLALCGGVAGVVIDGEVFHAPNLSEWDGVKIGERLRAAFTAPAYIRNDVALAALGEAHYGAGQGSDIFVYVTVSTGVNGAKIERGRLDDYTYGFEIGHQMIGESELQNLVSGTAVKARFGVEPKDLGDTDTLETLAKELAVGLYNTTLHWSPDTIVLGGSMIVGENAIPLDIVGEELARRVSKYYPKAPDIKKATLGDVGGLWGAKAYMLQMVGEKGFGNK